MLAYRVARNDLKRHIRGSRRQTGINFACNGGNDPKKFFKFNNFKKKDKKIGSIKSNNEVISSDGELINIFNSYFASVFTDENLKDNYVSNEEIDRQDIKGLTNVQFNEDTIKNLLNKIDPSKAAGPDDIYGRVLKEGSDSIAKALFIIFTRSLKFCELPKDWKIAHVVPIFKKCRKEDLGNYRPVSLTSLVVKILERLLKSDIEEHLDA